jgi:hypothetical protein
MLLRVGERSKQNLIHDREHRRHRSDTERDQQNRSPRERGAPHEGPRRETQVLRNPVCPHHICPLHPIGSPRNQDITPFPHVAPEQVRNQLHADSDAGPPAGRLGKTRRRLVEQGVTELLPKRPGE